MRYFFTIYNNDKKSIYKNDIKKYFKIKYLKLKNYY